MKEQIVIFTGAGVSAESGLKTFRDKGGYWTEYDIESVASIKGWQDDPEFMLSFYNELRLAVMAASPNAAHAAIAALEAEFDVVVVSQNVDDLHERAGSSNVIHLHGEILKSRSTADPSLVYAMTKPSIELGDVCENGSQLRPHIVWFGEDALHMKEAAKKFATASKILIVGTSLTVNPAARLVKKARYSAEKYLVSLDAVKIPYGYRFFRGHATNLVTHIVSCWLKGHKPC